LSSICSKESVKCPSVCGRIATHEFLSSSACYKLVNKTVVYAEFGAGLLPNSTTTTTVGKGTYSFTLGSNAATNQIVT
jgi:hypothetical protein